MDAATILTGIGAILTAAGGIVLVIREFRRRDRKAMQSELNDLNRELTKLQHDYLELRKFMLQISQLLIDHGIESPEVPRHE